MTLFSQLVPNASLVTANSTQTLTNKTLNSPILVTPNLGVASANSITANLGAVGTPSYTFTGDLNTGMWSPAADTLAFSEGGVEAMRITSAGNVGIGTTSPAQRLHVATTAAPSGTTQSFLRATADVGFGADFGGGIIQGIGPIATISTVSSGTATERMRIDSSGNVGIGTSAPGYKLDVSATGNISGQFKTSGSINALFLADAGTTAETLYVGTVGNDFRVVTGSNERMRINSSGNVGIGTSAPSAKLNVAGDTIISGNADARQIGFNFYGTSQYNFYVDGATDAAKMTIRRGTTSVATFDTNGNVGIGVAPIVNTRLYVRTAAITDTAYYADNGVNSGFKVLFGSNITSILNDFAQPLAFGTNNTENMRIMPTGNVGIGTTAPGTKLEVFNSGDAYIRVTGNIASGNAAGIQFYRSGGSVVNAQISAVTEIGNDYGVMRFNTAGASGSAERMRIDSSGNVGIGLTPTAKLHVAGTIQSSSGSTTAQMFSDGGAAYFTSVGSYPSIFSTNSVERMRITADGNVRIGSTSGGARLSVVSTLSTNLLIEKNSLPEAYSPGTFSSKNAYMPSGTQENWVAASSASTVAGYLIDITAYNGASASDVYFGAEAGPAVGSGGPANFVFGRRTGTQTWAETMRINSVGNVGIGTTTPGYTLEVNGSFATGGLSISNTGVVLSANTADAVGYKGLPQNSQTAAYGLALADMGKMINITTGGVVIPANANVAFPLGSTIVIYNNSASSQTISITTDTMYLAGSATTGSRTLAQRGLATCVKVTANNWVISGAGVT